MAGCWITVQIHAACRVENAAQLNKARAIIVRYASISFGPRKRRNACITSDTFHELFVENSKVLIPLPCIFECFELRGGGTVFLSEQYVVILIGFERKNSFIHC